MQSPRGEDESRRGCEQNEADTKPYGKGSSKFRFIQKVFKTSWQYDFQYRSTAKFRHCTFLKSLASKTLTFLLLLITSLLFYSLAHTRKENHQEVRVNVAGAKTSNKYWQEVPRSRSREKLLKRRNFTAEFPYGLLWLMNSESCRLLICENLGFSCAPS
jgi:hypothetical protein